ncbi:TetR/AcrR family transcriptional regulator [Lacrimispora sp. 38-1]|uniref:TetR/AcrR family transcriptional regulator n=1 Tax=Lacrimispora sp. 38-1 TaxID=3125778 RepID=UPI003CEDCCBD
MKKQPEITMQTRKNLADAFWQIYCEKRIEKITVKDITTKAGYNRSTFYEYFTDVYDVLEQIESSVLPDIEKHKKFLLNKDMQFPLKHLVEVYSKNKQYLVVLLGKNGDPAFQEKMKNTYKDLVRPILQSYETDEYILEYGLEYGMSAIIGMITYCFTREEHPDIERMVRLLDSFMNDGILKDSKLIKKTGQKSD